VTDPALQTPGIVNPEIRRTIRLLKYPENKAPIGSRMAEFAKSKSGPKVKKSRAEVRNAFRVRNICSIRLQEYNYE
jgi:hypothetical protein